MLAFIRSYMDKEVQRDKKLVSYEIVDRGAKPHVQVKTLGVMFFPFYDCKVGVTPHVQVKTHVTVFLRL